MANSLFGQDQDELVKKQGRNLLRDYGHPWDSIAEGAQNALDAVNRKYRVLLADELGIEEENLREAMSNAADTVVEEDSDVFEENYNRWVSDDYKEEERDRWYEALAEELGISKEELKTKDEKVRTDYTGIIEIERNPSNREIRIKDNGVGMSLDELEHAVLKGGSFKKEGDRSSEIGELGNGLTYQICSCDDFRIETSDGEGVYADEIEDMHTWLNDREGDIVPTQPKSNPHRIETESKESYTEVIMADIREVDSDFTDIFSSQMTVERFIHLLRTKTAIGYLYSVLNYPVFDTLREDDIEVKLVNTGEGDKNIKLRYRGPVQVSEEADPTTTTLYSRDRAEEELDNDRDIGGSALYHRGIYESPTGITLYYMAFVTSRPWFKKASRQLGLCDEPSKDLDDIDTYDIQSAAELGVKGMPTAYDVGGPSTDSLGYFANMHIIIQDNRLEFDEGRKYIVGSRLGLYRECVRDVLYDEISTNLIKKAISDPVVAVNISDMYKQKREFVTDNIENREGLDTSSIPDGINFENEPQTEQDVVGIFHELIGNNYLDEYYCLATSTFTTYDAIFRYKAQIEDLGQRVQHTLSGETVEEEIILEYKLNGEDVLQDVSKKAKFYYMMDVLVCWTINAEACRNMGAHLEEKRETDTKYIGTTHQLDLASTHLGPMGGDTSLEVIELKTLLGH